jgi:aspartate racemase
MKRMGVIGGISPQATMDFEARVHRVAQRLAPPDWNRGYPPMTVWYHRRLPMRLGADGAPIVPMEIDPLLLEAAAWLGRVSDFLVMPCNSAHVGAADLARAGGCPVLSMIEVTVAEVLRRGWKRIGVLGFHAAPPLYLDPLRRRGIHCETIDARAQAELDAGIRAVMEGRDGAAEARSARAAVATLRAAAVEGVVLGCTELPLLVGDESDAADLINPTALLAEAAVRLSLGEPSAVVGGVVAGGHDAP